MLAVNVLDYAAERAPAGEFANQPVIQGRILEAIGQTYFDLGFYDKANDVLSQAGKRSLDRSRKRLPICGADCKLHSGALRLDRKPNEALAASEQNWREAIALRGNGSPEEITARHEYTMALMSVGDIEGAAILVAEVQWESNPLSRRKDRKFRRSPRSYRERAGERGAGTIPLRKTHAGEARSVPPSMEIRTSCGPCDTTARFFRRMAERRSRCNGLRFSPASVRRSTAPGITSPEKPMPDFPSSISPPGHRWRRG